MNAFHRQWTMALWAMGDVLRRPAEALLTAGVLATLTVTLGVPMAATKYSEHLLARALETAPALVIRRVDPTGWRPIPLSAVKTVAAIPGATGVRPRIWGRVPSSSGAVTALAWAAAAESDARGVPAPAAGTVVTGSGLPAEGPLRLFGTDGSAEVFTITGAIPCETAGALVIMSGPDARRLLGIPDGHATDLAVTVFHDEEIAALTADVIAALPFAVNIDDRNAAAGRYRLATARRGGRQVAMYFPAILTLVLLAVVNMRRTLAGARATALLRAVGWSSADIHRRDLYAAIWITVPAVTAGAVTAAAILFFPQMSAVGALLWGEALPPGLSGSFADTVGIVLVTAAALVGTPFLVAAGLANLAATARAGAVPPPADGVRP